MTNHTFTMTERKAELIHKMAEDHMAALKNWIVSAVEDGQFDRAVKMAAEVREYQTIFAAFNMPAKHTIAECTAKPLVTNHTVKES